MRISRDTLETEVFQYLFQVDDNALGFGIGGEEVGNRSVRSWG